MRLGVQRAILARVRSVEARRINKYAIASPKRTRTRLAALVTQCAQAARMKVARIPDGMCEIDDPPPSLMQHPG